MTHFQRGQTVRPLYPNADWGIGEIIDIHTASSVKPYTVRRLRDGTIGHFHAAQLEHADVQEEQRDQHDELTFEN